MLRSTGVKRDLRLDLFESYGNYFYLNFKSFYSKQGDSYDRYLLRMNEMLESINIINQLVSKLLNLKSNKINKNSLMNYHEFNNYSFISNFLTMEQTIQHFKY
jgi:NADH:ubiquinone oxidoreductase subunit D